MGSKAGLAEFVVNSEVITSAFGSWPSLHDAEIVAVELERENGPRLALTLNVLLYDPDGKATWGMVTFVFEGVSDVFLRNFNAQNAVWDLLVDETEEGKKLLIESSYGLEGEVRFETARVLRAEAGSP